MGHMGCDMATCSVVVDYGGMAHLAKFRGKFRGNLRENLVVHAYEPGKGDHGLHAGQRCQGMRNMPAQDQACARNSRHCPGAAVP